MRRLDVFLSVAVVAILGMFVFASVGNAGANGEPSKVTFKSKKGNVTFDHDLHKTKGSCKACHHKGQQSKCSTCHTRKGENGNLNTKKAYHKNCKGCHKKDGGPTKCKGCHIK